MGKFEDLTGQTFGLWHVDKLGPKVGVDEKVTTWICTCKCGTVRPVRAGSLKSGKSLCCGCIRPHENLSGERFGRLEVLYELDRKVVGNRKKIQYLCHCDCGNDTPVLSEHLKSGNTKSCGCLQKDFASQLHFVDLIGHKFGRLTVESCLGVNEYQHRVWHCRCDCGNYVDADTARLQGGYVLSCGCYRRDLFTQDLTDKRYGLLTVLSYAGQYKSGGSQWLCQCDCGKTTIVRASSLVSGDTCSCGCWKASHLELLTSRCLFAINYDFKSQIKFDDLVGLGGYPLSYDFGVYDDDCLKGLIECQGKQHYEPIDYFGGLEQFHRQQIHDKLKKEYALQHDIPLLEIPYTYNTYEEIVPYVSSFCELVIKQEE